MALTFLETVVDDLTKKQVNWAQCTIVLPSKRSGTFLKTHISAKINKTIFSPEIFSIQDFISNIAGIDLAPNIDLLIGLYNAYKTSRIEQPDDFSSFLKWGNTLLQDFSEIDAHLVPPSDILNYLSAIKELDHWSLTKQKTDLIENYLQLWSNLESIYNEFTASLTKKSKGHPGLAQRMAVKKLDEGHNPTEGRQVIFVGFNALSTAEARIVQYFLNEQNAFIYWDIDSYFLDDFHHDAGLFIRKYQSEWEHYKNKAPIEGQNHFLSPKKISIIGVPKNISQTKYIGGLLEEIQEKSPAQIAQTALVLADETLLHPILQAIPRSITKVNITMGLPLDKTVFYSFFVDLLDLQSAFSDQGFFYKPVLKFLANPYSRVLGLHQEHDFAQMLSEKIKQFNWVYITHGHLSKILADGHILWQMFPTKTPSPSHFIEICISLIERLKYIFQKEQNALELERLYHFYALCNQLKRYVVTSGFTMDIRSIKTLFKQLASMETMDFVGEPLTGLQIMGVLETRNLDFETVIISSVNEGILPAGKSNNSFLPFDVKRDYGLPTYKEKDAIFVYHFYRLIQRAKHVYITYNTEPDVLEGGEMSRLVAQLLSDPNLEAYVTHEIASSNVKLDKQPSFHIQKSTLLLEDIKSFATSGFSPSSLTNYIKNPLDFYTRNLLRINDVEEVEENIAANTFGTILHNCLEELYIPLVGKTLNLENVNHLYGSIPNILQSIFKRTLPAINTSKGPYALVFNVIRKYLENFIAMEAKQVRTNAVKLIALEKKYEMPLHVSGVDFPVVLKGTIDRVDEVNGITRIIDYKTGRVEPKNVIVNDWGKLLTDYDKSKAFQLLTYAYLYRHNSSSEELQAGIYSFKTLGKGLLLFNAQKNTIITDDILSSFETNLMQLIHEICNPQVSLVEKTE